MYYRVILQEEFLWQQFNSLGNEMIITRSGRCLFPLFKIGFESYSPSHSSSTFNCVDIRGDSFYRIGIVIEQLDWMKWRYREGQWQPILGGLTDVNKTILKLNTETIANGGGNEMKNETIANGGRIGTASSDNIGSHLSTIYEPFETPKRGNDLIESGVSFSKLKLVNRSSTCSSSTLISPSSSRLAGEGINQRMREGGNGRKYRAIASLHSFHRYRPLVYIKQVFPELPFTWNRAQRIFYPETQFIAVTHYQNESITLLKKSYNPHAKGFVINNYDQRSQADTDSSIERKRHYHKRRRVYPIQFNEPSRKSLLNEKEEEEMRKINKGRNEEGEGREGELKEGGERTISAISEASEEEVVAGLALQKMSFTSSSSQTFPDGH